jgi:2-alkenal reductase
MMGNNNRRLAMVTGLGCAALCLVLAAAAAGVAYFFPARTQQWSLLETEEGKEGESSSVAEATVEVVPTLTPASQSEETREEATPAAGRVASIGESTLSSLYKEVNPGVVNIRVYVEREGMTGQGAGSGFILDDDGHIVTNNHVVAQADRVTTIFHNGIEAEGEIIGADDDSDLAIIKVDQMPDDAHPLSLADSDDVIAGDWAVAIGNPFSLGGSMSLGIVSAVGRAIPSGTTPFRIPQSIQTDAAINPGNSGGPLLNVEGDVIGVNAQIASGGTRANAGVGFAIPSNVVRLVAPSLIENGAYDWPWLGVTGGSINLMLQQANDLEAQQGAYIAQVANGGPAEEAGLRGATGTQEINGREIPIGGDVVVEADGQPIVDFNDLLAYVAFQQPGDTIELTVLRDGERQTFTVELIARPSDFGN